MKSTITAILVGTTIAVTGSILPASATTPVKEAQPTSVSQDFTGNSSMSVTSATDQLRSGQELEAYRHRGRNATRGRSSRG